MASPPDQFRGVIEIEVSGAHHSVPARRHGNHRDRSPPRLTGAARGHRELLRGRITGLIRRADGSTDSALLLPPCRRRAEWQDASHPTQIGSHLWSTI
jgi:hypothetical protein